MCVCMRRGDFNVCCRLSSGACWIYICWTASSVLVLELEGLHRLRRLLLLLQTCGRSPAQAKAVEA